MFAHRPSRSIPRKKVPGSLPQSSSRSGARKNRLSGWPSTPWPVKSDAERVAHPAVGAVAGDQIVRGHAFARTAVEIDEFGGDAVAQVLERFQPRAVAQAHGRKGLREVVAGSDRTTSASTPAAARGCGSAESAPRATAAGSGRVRSRQGSSRRPRPKASRRGNGQSSTWSAMPQRRQNSIVRVLTSFIFGVVIAPSVCSTSSQRMPRQPRSPASASPTGPPPTIRTGT